MRHAVHVGTVLRAACLLSEEVLGVRRVRTFILENLDTLSAVRATPHGLLVRFARPTWVPVEASLGLTLVEEDRGGSEVLTAVPLTQPALEALGPPRGAIVLAHHGALVVLAPPFAEVDPSTWLDLHGIPLVETAPLGPPPPRPRLAAPVARPIDAILGPGIPSGITPEAERVLEALHPDEATANWPGRPERPVAKPWTAALAGRLARTVATALALFQKLYRRPGVAPPSAEGRGDALARVEAPPSFIGRVLASIDRWVRRQLARSRLSEWLFRKQADYVARLFEAFDEGDLDEALRRAIPLGKEGEVGTGKLALGVPAPRTSLQITTARSGGGPSFALGGIYAALQERYRRAAERLERDGRIGEAAFVLAELLREEEAAVALLERHGKLREAAELAEGRDLAPGLVVRQWFRAGDRGRAIAAARRRGGVLDAIARLERSGHHDDGRSLRLLYAEHLARTGDFAGAVDLALPVPEAANLLIAWAERGRAQGGVGGARMLALQHARGLAHEADVARAARDLVSEEGPEGRARRLAFAASLSEHARSPRAVVRTRDGVSRTIARALYADAPSSYDGRLAAVTSALVELSGDAGLRVDAPRWPAMPFGRRYRHVLAADDRGRGAAVHDAVPLDRGRTVVALGEAGVAIVDARGKQIAHFDQPAEALVVSDRRDRLLTVASRGRVARIGRVDLVARRSEAFCELELESFATTFDGGAWLVTMSSDGASRLSVVDACDTEVSLLAQSAELGSFTTQVLRAVDHVDALSLRGPGTWCVHAWDLPSLTLRRRWDLAIDGAARARWLLAPDGVYVGLLEMEDERLLLATRGKSELWQERPLDLEHVRFDADSHAASERFVVLGRSPAADSLVLVVLARKDLSIVGELVVEGTEGARLRLFDGVLTVVDARGRVVAFDLESGELVRQLRL